MPDGDRGKRKEERGKRNPASLLRSFAGASRIVAG